MQIWGIGCFLWFRDGWGVAWGQFLSVVCVVYLGARVTFVVLGFEVGPNLFLFL